MIVLGFAVLLYAVAAYLMWLARRRDPTLVGAGVRQAFDQFLFVLPRLVVGLMGAGFIAALVPPSLVETYLGEGVGVSAYLLAYLIGALIPGGPVVGFALGVAALKAGASVPVVMVFVTAWGLVNVPRIFIWEMAMVPQRIIILRMIVSAPVPVLTGMAVALLV